MLKAFPELFIDGPQNDYHHNYETVMQSTTTGATISNNTNTGTCRGMATTVYHASAATSPATPQLQNVSLIPPLSQPPCSGLGPAIAVRPAPRPQLQSLLGGLGGLSK